MKVLFPSPMAPLITTTSPRLTRRSTRAGHENRWDTFLNAGSPRSSRAPSPRWSLRLQLMRWGVMRSGRRNGGGRGGVQGPAASPRAAQQHQNSTRQVRYTRR